MNELDQGLLKGEDGQIRCWWCGKDPFYQLYHDLEWGRPVYDDTKLYEKICLETFQSGLSWLTVLRKRENFRKAFAQFDVHKVAAFGEQDIQRLMADAGIIRNRKKIEAAIGNARAVCNMLDKGETLTDFFWSRLPPPDERPQLANYESLMVLAKTPTSQKISKDLKERGFAFVGPVTVYAHMQAMGMVNDHLEGCFVRDEISGIK
jgi:DNA-3-methyladenine glycosylase I